MNSNKSKTPPEALIRGVFPADKASDLIRVMFESKIRMHALSSFGSWARTGSESSHDNTRVNELRASLNKLLKAIREREDQATEVNIDCVVKMKFVKKKGKKA